MMLDDVSMWFSSIGHAWAFILRHKNRHFLLEVSCSLGNSLAAGRCLAEKLEKTREHCSCWLSIFYLELVRSRDSRGSGLKMSSYSVCLPRNEKRAYIFIYTYEIYDMYILHANTTSTVVLVLIKWFNWICSISAQTPPSRWPWSLFRPKRPRNGMFFKMWSVFVGGHQLTKCDFTPQGCFYPGILCPLFWFYFGKSRFMIQPNQFFQRKTNVRHHHRTWIRKQNTMA